MTEIEQLRADLATVQKAAEIAKRQGFHERTGNYDMVEGDLKQKIADLEAQQEPIDPWIRVKEALFHWDANDKEPDYITKRSIFAYIQSLQAEVDELKNELRCERIDGSKVRDDLRARIAEMEQHGRKVDQANHEHYGRLQDQLAIRDLKIEKLESQLAAEKQFAQRMVEHAQVTCVERDKLIQEVKALKQKPETTETLEVCSVCNFPLSACDTPGVDGIPRMDCKMCQLKDQLQEINTLKTPLESNRVLQTAAEIMFTLHISNKVLSTAFQNWLNRYFKFYKNKPSPYAWRVSRK